jgi:hypothetical protein
MTNPFSIGHSTRTSTKVLCNKLWWTLTAGQFSIDQQQYGNRTTDRKEKIKTPRFAFLKISACPLVAHLQSRTSQLSYQSFVKELQFATTRLKISGLTLLTFLTLEVLGQEPQTPTFEKFTPVSPKKSHSTGQPQQQTNTQQKHSYGSALQGKKADEIAASRNVNYALPDNIYNSLNQNNFVLTSSSSIPGKNMSSVNMVHSVLNEMNYHEKTINYHFPSLAAAPGYSSFVSAYQELLDMLEGRKPLDLKRAVFITENAFFGNQMNYNDYLKNIKEMALLIQLKMKQENLPLNDNDAILYMAHQYMSDTLDIELPFQEKTATTFPKRYDFKDPFGYDDPRKMFVSKLMAENTGQCKSLPLLFLILINELGGEAYLSFSPSHSYIKCKDKNGVWYNIELTNGMLTSDSWVVGSGYVKSEAVKSGIFLDTLNKKQVIAQCLVDLAQYYGWRYNSQDDFVLKCVNKAIDHHSNNIWAIQVKSDYYTMLFKYVSGQKGYTDPSHLKNDQKAMELFMQRNRLYALIDGLGYQPMPEQAYMDWLKTLEEKQQQQEHDQNYFNFSKIIR